MLLRALRTTTRAARPALAARASARPFSAAPDIVDAEIVGPPPARRIGQRPPPNQHLLAAVEALGRADVGALWGHVETEGAAWPAESRPPTKSALKRELRYLVGLKLLRVVPGAPFSYAVNWARYENRLRGAEADAAPSVAPDSS
mmetsp:Transcript_2301/g.6819  ORF Transcript_2301/g.6819 Transcript_2301/m.6819 type:complete len:145 (+) Transcript_2301:149-583(+)